jgi:hypothetical protein
VRSVSGRDRVRGQVQHFCGGFQLAFQSGRLVPDRLTRVLRAVLKRRRTETECENNKQQNNKTTKQQNNKQQTTNNKQQ